MQWLLAKLASQIKLAETEMQEGNSIEGASSTFRESILFPEEEKMIHSAMYVPFKKTKWRISIDPVSPSKASIHVAFSQKHYFVLLGS